MANYINFVGGEFFAEDFADANAFMTFDVVDFLEDAMSGRDCYLAIDGDAQAHINALEDGSILEGLDQSLVEDLHAVLLDM